MTSVKINKQKILSWMSGLFYFKHYLKGFKCLIQKMRGFNILRKYLYWP